MQNDLMEFVKFGIYYGSYAYFLATPLIVWWLFKGRGVFAKRSVKGMLVLLLIGLSVLAWARFIEPRILLTRSNDISLCAAKAGNLKVAVFSDTHHGMFKNGISVERIVARLKVLAPDFVLIPGDFTYHLKPDDFEETYAPFTALEMPVYAVMGNHDEGIPGDDVSDILTSTLSNVGVRVIDGTYADYMKGDSLVRIIGSVDHWAAEASARPYFSTLPEGQADFTIMLQHNPDAVFRLARLSGFNLMVAGHTHGGQINIPIVTCALTLACRTLRYGYAERRGRGLFVTSGTGMVSLPMRLNVPPVIDVLSIRYRNCESTL